MGNVTVKICGLKTEKDVMLCMKSGVDVLGFVTEYPIPVPWNLTGMEANELLSFVSPPYKTCLVTGGEPEKVIKLAERLRPSMLQLHFRETIDDTSRIAKTLKVLNIDTIKTIPITEEEQSEQFGTNNIEFIVKALCETEIYGILVDSRTPSNVIEESTRIDPSYFVKIKSLSSKPVILAGGITPENVMDMVVQSKAEFIDVMTGVEESTGIKDEEKLDRLISFLTHGRKM